MAISQGDRLPDADLIRMGQDGPEHVTMAELVSGRKVAIFALPGAYTGTCTTAHVPSFMRTKAAFDAKGVDEVICLSVNDPFVLDAWGRDTGAIEKGISFVGDPAAAFTKAVGMEFSAPVVGLIDRSVRYAMYVEDGVVKVLLIEEGRGTCDMTAGEALLEAM